MAGEVEIFLGEAAGIVSYEGEADAVVTDVDIGMMAGRFSLFAHLVDEMQRGTEVFELKCFDKLSGLYLPTRQPGQARTCLFERECLHVFLLGVDQRQISGVAASQMKV
jgi:hypothetical protein